MYSSLELTGYYNEHPHYLENYFERKNKPVPNFKSAKNIVIIGIGNVALDVARICSMSTDNANLQYSDINKKVYNELKNTNLENIFVVGRGSPKSFKGTRKELKELLERSSDTSEVNILDHGFDENLHDSLFLNDKAFAKFKKEARKDLSQRGQFRTYAYLRDMNRVENPEKMGTRDKRQVQFRFFREPVEITDKSVKFMVNKDESRIEEIDADMVVLCTGNYLTGWENFVELGIFCQIIIHKHFNQFDF